MNRRSHSNHGQRNNPRRGGPGKGGSPRSGPGKPAQKTVSPMYKVDLMHHHLTGMNSQPPQHTGKPPARHQPPRIQESKKVHHAKVKKGYTSLSLELKDDIYNKFLNKVQEKDKSPKEVMNQLISFYNMGKINI
ncbi:MAG: hypothetical protein ACE5EN_02105 [Nitrospinota bacterium]